MNILNAQSLRSLIKQANDLRLKREDVVSILQIQGQFYLVYFTD